MIEKWVAVYGYENMYEVSSFGRVKSLAKTVNNPIHGTINRKERMLKPVVTKKGYYQVALYINDKKKVFALHRLVAIHFLQNHDNLPEVNHMNTLKYDNAVSNLEWCTGKHNMEHAVNAGIFKRAHEKNSKKVIIYKGSDIREFNKIIDAAAYLNTTSGSVGSVLNGSRKLVKGYSVKYVIDANRD